MRLIDIKTAVRLPYAFYRDLATLGDTGVFIDVGANIGTITRIAHAFSKCRILAVEPNPVALERLAQLQKNRARVSIFPVALGGDNARANLYLHENSAGNELDFSEGGSLRVDKVNVSSSNCITVNVVDVCDFLDSVAAKNILIKLDVEGAEIEILRRIAQWGGVNRIKKIWCETHENRFPGANYESQLEDVRRSLEGVVEVNYQWH